MNSYSLLEKLFQKNSLVAGIDEAGRGPLAGPVVAGVVAIKKENLPFLKKQLGVKDSKKLNSQKRDILYKKIKGNLLVGIGICPEETIDRINILQGTFLAMKRALTDLKERPDYLLVDGNFEIPNLSIIQKAEPKADELIPLVSAASIIAKVTRDKIICKLAKKYKGYGTQRHLVALKKYGPCPIHRKSFQPIKKMIAEKNGL